MGMSSVASRRNVWAVASMIFGRTISTTHVAKIATRRSAIRRGDLAEASHDVGEVGVSPLLRDLAVADPNDLDHAPLAVFAGRRDVEQSPEMRARGAQASHDEVAFGNHVEDLVVPVGERAAPRVGQPLQALE